MSLFFVAPEYYADLLEIRRSFPFDIMVADCAFSGIPFVTGENEYSGYYHSAYCLLLKHRRTFRRPASE